MLVTRNQVHKFFVAGLEIISVVITEICWESHVVNSRIYVYVFLLTDSLDFTH